MILYNRGDYMQLQQEYIQLIKQWESTESAIYKTNIKVICDLNDIKPKQIESGINVSYDVARSLTNASHKARIPFLIALKLAKYLKVDIEKFLENI